MKKIRFFKTNETKLLACNIFKFFLKGHLGRSCITMRLPVTFTSKMEKARHQRQMIDTDPSKMAQNWHPRIEKRKDG